MNLRNQFAIFDRGLIIASENILDRNQTLSGLAYNLHGGIERQPHRGEIEMRVAVRKIAADGRDISDAHVSKMSSLSGRQQANASAREPSARSRRTSSSRQCEDECHPYSRQYDKRPANSAQADEADRLEYLRLHHQHQRSAAAHRTNCRIAMIQQRKGFIQGARLGQLEAQHRLKPEPGKLNDRHHAAVRIGAGQGGYRRSDNVLDKARSNIRIPTRSLSWQVYRPITLCQLFRTISPISPIKNLSY